MRTWFLLLFVLLGGCASVERRPDPPPTALFDDAAFPPPTQAVDAADLFTLSPAMKAHLHSAAFKSKLQQRGAAQGLVMALYDKSDLLLDYEAKATLTAAQTYAARAGNCLSLVIMTAAFARELNMRIRYQSVESDEVWSRADSLYLVSGHVNISLAPPKPRIDLYDHSTELVVDFMSSVDAARLRTRELQESDIVALYMNNRAAEELVQGRTANAYWWVRAALTLRPSTLTAYNTLAVVYQRSGRPLLAERVYRLALEREPDSLIVMQNLAPLLAANGKTAEAEAMTQRLARLYPAPPYHYFDQGVLAYRAGDFTRARTLFAREVARAPYNDEFHFWLGLSNFQLGELGAAEKQLALAREHSVHSERRERYAAKLSHLRGIAAGMRRN